MVMFDSLNRHMLPPYGGDWTHAPNFARLAERSTTFDTCYAGSMPCMPARREIHTGRHNFLHRSWGPLEPFDDSMPELLKQSGVYTHLVSDHPHYWEDGGATYHGRYNTWEFFRGQEGDPWKGQVADPEIPEDLKKIRFGAGYRQDWVNRPYMATEDRHPQTLTFDAGLEFLRTNQEADRWFVQIETFDPHEPFFSHQPYKDLYPHDYDGPHFDWPDYKRVTETPDQVEHGRFEYAALLSMCDHSLGRVLDTMDELGMWDDTLLVVCTDHGLLLGEKAGGARASSRGSTSWSTCRCSPGIRAAPPPEANGARHWCRPSTWPPPSWSSSASTAPRTCRENRCPSARTPRAERPDCSVSTADTSTSPTAATSTCAPPRPPTTRRCSSTP